MTRVSYRPLLSTKVTLAHGSGGRETEDIVLNLIVNLVPESLRSVPGGVGLEALDDGAAIPVPGGYMVFTVDSYTVNPPFFPGGNIGSLAASGTINDLLMMGARPVAALDAIVVEEGFEVSKLREITESLIKTLAENNVALIGGDFKVLPKGQLDKIVVTVAGIGFAKKLILDSNIKPGDKIIVTGPIAEHGALILALQQNLEPKDLVSDAKPLTDLMLPLIEEYGDYIHAARDPTRGGLAMALNDWAEATGTVIVIDEEKIPIREPVRAYTEMLGVDPLTLASEGVALLAVDASKAEEVLQRIHELGYKEARIIGEVKKAERHKGIVLLKSVTGGVRILEPPSGEIVPRIC
ncbi:hydrogenase expression/formation protein HypE [Pyrolobus fumarii 1A]|uniref:Hydrogenase expression/formation protein HypE n=1 Tax=Pyrolobus fumarii (strain DSM 11204 / 1A) TaxID=694429 RepID=G0ED06_PYRF1|nr:hydrogenase expression/formation protein HypE [Pyrolobus fumarii]AEM38565.1 hydrogenase expression/formation protein HypE [Pyrolobus fumarii 1A]